VDINE